MQAFRESGSYVLLIIVAAVSRFSAAVDSLTPSLSGAFP